MYLYSDHFVDLQAELSSENTKGIKIFLFYVLYFETIEFMKVFLFYFYSSPEDMFIDLRERERERHCVRKKHQSLASYICPSQGLNPPPRCGLWPGIEPATFWCTRPHSNQVSYLARAMKVFLLCLFSTSSPIPTESPFLFQQNIQYYYLVKGILSGYP